MPEFKKVSIKMAKTQGLSLNPGKISGLCGRLMCCLSYESEYYADAYKKMPKTGSEVGTPRRQGNGRLRQYAEDDGKGKDRRPPTAALSLRIFPPRTFVSERDSNRRKRFFNRSFRMSLSLPSRFYFHAVNAPAKEGKYLPTKSPSFKKTETFLCEPNDDERGARFPLQGDGDIERVKLKRKDVARV